MPIVFGLLGPLTARDGGEPRAINSPKHRLLLAHLLLNANRPVTAEQLLTVLWGEEQPRTAAASLHNHVARLRRSLGATLGGRLRSTASGYLLDVAEGELDSAVFTAHLGRARTARAERDWPQVGTEVAAALALWRGEPAEELALAAGEPETARLTELRLQALDWRFEAELESGRHHGLSAELSLLVAEHPLRESFHRHLMLALHRSGRQADALAAYRTLRRTLVEELGIEPGDAVRRAHEEILSADVPAADGPSPDRPSSAGPANGPTDGPTDDLTDDPVDEAADDAPVEAAAVLRPAQLPSAPGDFTGRQSQLDALALYLRPGEPDTPARVVLVTGMGGVGKTSLVLHGAHAVRCDYPDGQLYADLHGFGLSEARTPHDLLGRFLADLGVPGQMLPEHTDDRSALFRTLLAERRVLVVLDNARDSRQLTPLLPGAGRSAVVVTSRHRLPGVQCSTRIALGPLSADEQRRLLGAMCGEDRVAADPVAASRIMAACAGLPLALRIAGSRLAHRPGWQLGELARRLGRSNRLEALAVDQLAVRDAFSFSYNSLLTGGRRVERAAARGFRLLGLWPAHPLAAESAAALFGTPVDDALDALDTLVDAHLLDVGGPGRFRFHDLLGEFAAEQAELDEPEEGRTAAQLRLLSWYAAATAAANHVVAPQALPIPPLPGVEEFELPDFADEDEALDWCAAELPAIRTAVRRAAELARPDIAWRIASGLFGYGLTYWWNGEWTECLTEALASASAGRDVLGQAWLHGRLGVAHGLARRNQLSVEHLKAALHCFEELGDLSAQRIVLSNLSAACAQLGDHEQARHYGELSSAMAVELAEPETTASDYTTLGGVLYGAGDLAGAARAYRAGADGWRALGSRSYLSLCLSNLGDTLSGLGRPEEAVELIAEALEIRRDQRDHHGVGESLEALGRTYLLLGDRTAAQRCFEEALELSEVHGLEHVTRLSLEGLRALAAPLAD